MKKKHQHLRKKIERNVNCVDKNTILNLWYGCSRIFCKNELANSPP